jgi:hypothetical protein
MSFVTQKSILVDTDSFFIGTSVYDKTTAPSNEIKITAFDGDPNDFFGYSVSVGSGRIVISSPQDDIGANGDQGSAYVYDLNGNLITKLTAFDGAANDYYGISVSVGSGRIVVSAYNDNVGSGQGQGSAYIYDLDGNFITKLIASDGTILDYFGSSVSVGSGRIVVGAYGDDIGVNTDQGSAYVYDLDGNFITKLTASDGAANDFFGYSVSVGSGRIVVGAYGDDTIADSSIGSAYVYDLDGNFITKLTAFDGTTADFFGYSVSVGCGRIVIGAYGDDIGANANQGSAYVYDLDGNFITKLTAFDGAANDFFGYSVSVGSGRIVVGAYGDDVSKGSAYVYDLDGNFITKLIASDGAILDYFGSSVSVGCGRIVIGAYQDDIGANTDQGSAYVYDTPKMTHYLDQLDGR